MYWTRDPKRVIYNNRVFDEIIILDPIRKVTIKGKAEGFENIGEFIYAKHVIADGDFRFVWLADDTDGAAIVVDNDGQKYLKNVALKEIKPPTTFEL
jgi:hypothetical protein